MDKNGWLQFLSGKVRAQAALDHVNKLQVWAFGLLALITFGMALNGMINPSSSRSYPHVTKIFFLTLGHLVLVLCVFLPSLLQKGDKPLTRVLGIRDFTSLIFITLLLTFYAYIFFALSSQIVKELENIRASAIFSFTAWSNAVLSGIYVAAFLFYFLSLAFFPKALTKWIERGSKTPQVLFAVHLALFVFGLMSCTESDPLGSTGFFEQFRIVGLFWMALISLLMYVGRFLGVSALGALSSLELEASLNHTERYEDLLIRFKEAFISRRLWGWIHKISHDIGTKSHEIAKYLHEAVHLIAEEKPSESQLAQVEDRYRKANQIYHKLQKSNDRFLLNISLFNLLDVELEKIAELKDQFSKEIRHAKLELSSVRKRIDDKLVSLKENERKPSEGPSVHVPVQKVPVSR